MGNITAAVLRSWSHWLVRFGLTVVGCAFAVWSFLKDAQGAWAMPVTVVASVIAATIVCAEFYRSHSLEERIKPRLRLVFMPADNPLYDSMHLDGQVRHIRVGVMNTGAQAIRDVAVMVTKIMPNQPGVFPMQALRQTHQEESVGRFTVNPSTEPLTFVELVMQHIDSNGRASSMRIDFVNNRRPLSTMVNEYMIWLSADGEGASNSIKIILRKKATGQFEPERALFP